jgi:hypothetical protein
LALMKSKNPDATVLFAFFYIDCITTAQLFSTCWKCAI